MNLNSIRSSKHYWLGGTISLGVIALALWLPALLTPWWGDDYLFLQGARASRLAGEPWWRPFWPEIHHEFWRPLGHETYWRFIEGTLGSDPLLAHLSNFVLWMLSCLAVGFFSGMLARALRWNEPVLSGAIATGVYSLLAMHFTPIHWISSDDSLFIVLWTALALTVWTASPTTRPSIRIILCGLLPVLQMLALMSKESGVLIPLLMVCVSACTWRDSKLGKPELTAWFACSALVVVWLILRVRFTVPPDPEYAMVFGSNFLRNTAALVAWLLNIPREALRMIALGPRLNGVLWACGAALPMMVVIYLAGVPLVKHVSFRQALAIVGFIVIGYAPYFFLAWQSYEYYAEVAMIMPTIFLARGLMLSNRFYVAVALLSLSSFIAVHGSREVDYPGLISRARWAEQVLSELVTQQISTPLVVQVSNPHMFSAIGIAGLAWRLGLNESDISLVSQCGTDTRRLLALQDNGVRWVECAKVE